MNTRRAAALAPGRYTLRPELSGFSTIEVRDLTMTIGFELKQDFAMKVQSVAETVTVKGAGRRHILVRGVGRDHRAADRDAADQLAPVPVVGAARAGHRPRRDAVVLPDRQHRLIAHLQQHDEHGRRMYNVMVEDGEPRQSLPEDAVQEFKVSSAQYNAEFGPATGGLLQVATKSGANTVHGTAFEYLRDKALNAQGVFETTKPDFRRNQFGGSMGGPVVPSRMPMAQGEVAAKLVW